MPEWFSGSKDTGGSMYSHRATMQKLDTLLVASGGLKFDDDMKKSRAMNNANTNVLEAMSGAEKERFDALSPYGKDEFKMATELQYLRRQLANLEEMEENNKQAQTMGKTVVRGSNSLPHSRQEMSKLSGDIRKRIQKLNAAAQTLQKSAKSEGKIDQAKEVLRHMENTKALYKKRFSVAASTYTGDGTEFGPIPSGEFGKGERGSLVTKEMDFNAMDSSEIRESLRDDAEFQMFFQGVTEKDAQIDSLVDTIAQGTTRLKDQVVGIQEELVKQKAILGETEEKVDDISAKTKGLNRKLKETIKKVDEDRVCIYAICFVLLLGLIGYILYALGIFGDKKKSQ